MCISLETWSGPALIIRGLGPLSIISLVEVNHELEWEEDCDEDPATNEDVPITIVEEEECYEDLNLSTATMTTSGYSTVVVKNKQGWLDCLQECGVRPVSAKC
jgi:hypothetical protein